MPLTLADPTTADWVAASVAAALVVVLAAVHLLRPVLARSSASPWGRASGLLLAMLTMGLVLCVIVAGLAGARADDSPAGLFVVDLVHAEPPTAARIAGYSAAVLLPLAAVLAVLAVAVIDVGRPSGLRIVAGVAAGVVLASGVLLVLGDVGTVTTGVGWAAAIVAAAAASALVVDEMTGRQPSSSTRSDGSTSRSQRSRQSRQR